MESNGWPARPGVPLNPERAGWHWVHHPEDLRAFPCAWDSDFAAWCSGGMHSPRGLLDLGYRYAGPCLTPAEHAAALADARAQGRREGLEEAAEVARCVPIPEDCCAAGAHGRISAALEAAMRIRALAQGGCDAG